MISVRLWGSQRIVFIWSVGWACSCLQLWDISLFLHQNEHLTKHNCLVRHVVMISWQILETCFYQLPLPHYHPLNLMHIALGISETLIQQCLLNSEIQQCLWNIRDLWTHMGHWFATTLFSHHYQIPMHICTYSHVTLFSQWLSFGS